MMWSIRYTKNKEKERNNMFKIKKLFNWIFAKPKTQQPIKHDTLRASSEQQWARFDAYMKQQCKR